MLETIHKNDDALFKKTLRLKFARCELCESEMKGISQPVFGHSQPRKVCFECMGVARPDEQ